MVLIAFVFYTAPGALLGWVSGLKLPWALASSVPVTFGTVGLAAWLLGQWDQRFEVGSYLLIFFGFLALAAVWRVGFLLVQRRSREPDVSMKDRLLASSRQGGILDPRWILPAAGSLTAMYLFFRRGFDFFDDVPHQLENIPQGWDVHWHGAMIRWIMNDGIADPTRMGELRNLETGADLYYPSGWHAGAALAGELAHLTPIAALNVANVIIPGILLPLSVAMIAWKMVGNRGLTAQLGAGIAAVGVFASPVLYWIGTYVGAWPYLAAVVASGIVLALFMHVPYRPQAAFAAALALGGMVQMHPAAVTIVILALVLWWLLYLVWVPSHRRDTLRGRILIRLRDIGWLALAGGVGSAVLLPQLLSGSDSTEEVAAFSATEDVTRGESWTRSFLMQTRHTDMFPDFDVRTLLIAAAIGAVVLLVWRRNFWAPAFYLISVWMTANALMPFDEPWGDLLGSIGNLHYATPHRLVMPVAMFTFAAAGIGIAAVIRLITLGPIRKFALGSTIASIVLGIGAGAGTVAWATTDRVMDGAAWAVQAPRTDQRMVSDVDLRAFDWLAQQPHAYDGLIMGEPADGHGWMYAYNSLPSLNRHYQWPDAAPDSDTSMAFWHGNLLGVGNHDDPDQTNDVDTAAKNLKLTYYFISPGSFWGFQVPNIDLIEGLWHAPGVTPVYHDENVFVFAVNQEFTDEQLAQMRQPGNSPWQLPPLKTDELGNPIFHRPTKPDLGGDNPLEVPDGAAPVEIPATRP